MISIFLWETASPVHSFILIIRKNWKAWYEIFLVELYCSRWLTSNLIYNMSSRHYHKPHRSPSRSRSKGHRQKDQNHRSHHSHHSKETRQYEKKPPREKGDWKRRRDDYPRRHSSRYSRSSSSSSSPSSSSSSSSSERRSHKRKRTHYDKYERRRSRSNHRYPR